MKLAAALLMIASGLPGAGHKQSDPGGYIILDGRPQPTGGVMTRSGYCGATRFSVTLASAGERLDEALRSVAVNGIKIAPSEKRKVLAMLPPRTFIIDACISECSRDRSPSARMQLYVITAPWRGNKERYLDFWVAPDGKVSRAGFN
jgi:hypothetical protein